MRRRALFRPSKVTRLLRNQAAGLQRPVSSVLVIGGSGDYFAVADTVIMMDAYVPKDVSAEAAAIAKEM